MTAAASTLALALACALGCSGNGAARASGKSAMTDPISLTCTTSTADGVVTLHLEAINRSTTTLHVLASPRLPYLLFEGGRAVVLYGVNDPDPDIDYYGIEIPPSRPLPPGDRVTASVQLVPLVPHHHYESKTEPVAVPPDLDVVCKLAYGDAPLDAQVINRLLAWQRWVTAPALRVATR